MTASNLIASMEDHALERVPDAERKNWLAIAWNTTGLVTTLVILFFGAVVCFVAGVGIALAAGACAFVIGSLLGWGLARIAYDTGCSNTLMTRDYGLGIRGSALASLIFGFLIVGFLAVENGLLYRGFLFFLEVEDGWTSRILIYGGMTLAWILLTAFGFALVTRVSSLMLTGFLLVLAWMVFVVVRDAGSADGTALLFDSQLDPVALGAMGIETAWDKFAFSLNILIGPACALALNTADFGRYGKSTGHVAAAAGIAIFFQSLLIMLVGGIFMYSAAPAMTEFYIASSGMTPAQAGEQVLRSPDSIAATFIVFGGLTGFALMLLAQAKAQVLNTYSSSLCIANLFDALFRWRPGRVFFVVVANVIALAMLYGHILEFVEAWIKLLGVLLSALAGIVIMDYYVARPRLERTGDRPTGEQVNWAGVVTLVIAVSCAHVLLRPYFELEVVTSLACVGVFYPLLRLRVLRPSAQRARAF